MSEYYSTHDAIQDKHNKVEKQLKIAPLGHELDDIRLALKALLDKVNSIDKFIRRIKYNYRGSTYDGDEYEKEVIKNFVEGIKNSKTFEEVLLLVK